MNDIEKTLMEEFLKRITLDVIAKDDKILIEAFKRRYGDKIDAERFVRELKLKFFDTEYEKFKQVLKEVEKEYTSILPEKQSRYLAATVFAESILNKPVPASLIFEVLRCAGMEEEKNFPNRYYYLKQLEEKGLVKKITVVNSKAEQLYCSTEEGKRSVKESEDLNKLIELEEKILNDDKVKKLIEMYSKEELKIEHEKPVFLKIGRIIRENGDSVSVLVYNDRVVNLTREELEKIDSAAKRLGRFKHSELMKEVGNDIKNTDFKVRAYIVYAYEKGLIDIVEGGSKGCVYERKRDKAIA